MSGVLRLMKRYILNSLILIYHSINAFYLNVQLVFINQAA
jgi:hypothetical protein